MKKTKLTSYANEDGVKCTIYDYCDPRPSERTWTLDKSKHTVWTQGRLNYTNGIRGTLGTIAKD